MYGIMLKVISGKLLKIIKYINKKEKFIDNILNKSNNGILYKYIFYHNNYDFKKYIILPKYKIQKIATGGNHLLILTNNNLVFTYGSNTFGQLGYKSNLDDENYIIRQLNDIPEYLK